MYNYIWKHLIDTEPRGEITYNLIKNHLPESFDSVLDCLCGFAPLRKHIKASKYYGFDLSEEAVKHLKETYSNSYWSVSNDSDYECTSETIDLILFLGIGAGRKPTDSKTEYITAKKHINKYKPNFIILETCCGHYNDVKNAKCTHFYDQIKNFCNTSYNILGEYKFDAKLNRKEVSERMMTVLKKK